jgi:Rieske Fe-S protein
MTAQRFLYATQGLTTAGYYSTAIPSRAEVADSEQNPISSLKAYYDGNHGHVQNAAYPYGYVAALHARARVDPRHRSGWC